MSLLLSDTARYGMPSLRLVVASAVLLFVGTGFGLEAGAQSTTLRLINQVSEPGVGTVPGNTLSGDARAAVLRRETDITQAYALSNLNFDRKDIKRKIQKGSAETFRLTEGGRTPQAFGQTRASNNVYYVLALTQEGKLLESYVNAGNRGYLPGFAIVASGDMPMGPVPEHREPLREALKSAVSPEVADTADGSQAEEETSGTQPAEEEKLSELTGGTSDKGGGFFQAFLNTLFSWYAALLLALLAGGIGGWGIAYRKYKGLASRRYRRIEKLKEENYNLRKEDNSSKEEFSSYRTRDKSAKKDDEIKKLREELREKKEEVRKMRKKMKSQKRREGKSRQSRGADKSPNRDRNSGAGSSLSRSSQQYSTDRTADLIGRAFVNWCHDAGAAMVDRHSMFANKLQDSLPGAELQRIFREKNAAGIVFADDVQDAVEYWHVRVDGRDFLLPQPHRSGFREVEECFLANCTSPNQIQEVEPAELQSSGGEYKLESEGMLA